MGAGRQLDGRTSWSPHLPSAYPCPRRRRAYCQHGLHGRVEWRARLQSLLGKQVRGRGPGRPIGSRNRHTENFLAPFCRDFEAHGADVIRKVRDEKPDVRHGGAGLRSRKAGVSGPLHNGVSSCCDGAVPTPSLCGSRERRGFFFWASVPRFCLAQLRQKNLTDNRSSAASIQVILPGNRTPVAMEGSWYAIGCQCWRCCCSNDKRKKKTFHRHFSSECR